MKTEATLQPAEKSITLPKDFRNFLNLIERAASDVSADEEHSGLIQVLGELQRENDGRQCESTIPRCNLLNHQL